MLEIELDWLEIARQLEKQVLVHLALNKVRFDELPEMAQTPSASIIALVCGSLELKDVPIHVQTPALVLLAMQMKKDFESVPHPLADWAVHHLQTPILSKIPAKAMIKPVWLKAVAIDAKNIRFIAPEILNQPDELTDLVVANSAVLTHIPEHLITKELCFKAFYSHHFSLKDLPPRYICHEIAVKACSKKASNFLYVPEIIISRDLVNLMVSKASSEEMLEAFRHSPKHFLEEKVLAKILCKNIKVIRLIEPKLLTKTLFLQIAHAIQEFSYIKYMPASVYDEELCRELIRINSRFLEFIPPEFKRMELCLQALNHDGQALAYIPKVLHSEALYEAALKKNGLALKHIPMPWRDMELPTLAVSQNGLALEFVPDDLKTYDMCQKAVSSNPNAFYWVPAVYRSKELVKNAVTSKPEIYEHLPPYLKTYELTELVLMLDQRMAAFAPDAMQYKSVGELI